MDRSHKGSAWWRSKLQEDAYNIKSFKEKLKNTKDDWGDVCVLMYIFFLKYKSELEKYYYCSGEEKKGGDQGQWTNFNTINNVLFVLYNVCF